MIEVDWDRRPAVAQAARVSEVRRTFDGFPEGCCVVVQHMSPLARDVLENIAGVRFGLAHEGVVLENAVAEGHVDQAVVPELFEHLVQTFALCGIGKYDEGVRQFGIMVLFAPLIDKGGVRAAFFVPEMFVDRRIQPDVGTAVIIGRRIVAEHFADIRKGAEAEGYKTAERGVVSNLVLADTAGNGAGQTFLPFIEVPVARFGEALDESLFVVRTAEEFIRGSSGASDSTAILKSLERAAKRTGESYVFSSQDIARDLLERNCALVSAIELKDTEGSVFSDTGEKTAVPVGYGLIKGDSLCGYITGDSARAVALLIGSDGIGQVTVETDRQVTLDVRTNGCEIIPHWEGGRIKSMDIKIKLNCAIGELSEALPSLTEAEYAAIDSALSEKAAGWVLEVLETQRLHGADFLGLCSRIRQKSPRDYAAAESEWPAAMNDTEYRVTVESNIRRDYDLHAPER